MDLKDSFHKFATRYYYYHCISAEFIDVVLPQNISGLLNPRLETSPNKSIMCRSGDQAIRRFTQATSNLFALMTSG
jgi:hypothetical protein